MECIKFDIFPFRALLFGINIAEMDNLGWGDWEIHVFFNKKFVYKKVVLDCSKS